MTKCPACRLGFAPGDYSALALHLTTRAGDSDASHVRWLNQNLTRQKSEAEALVPGLRRLFDRGSAPLSAWLIGRFVAKFYGKVPHPFVLALQHPSRATLLGYVLEHQHFLRQWVRSCAYIIARTDQPEVVRYEIDNISTEYTGGPSQPSHYELLVRMGESLGLDRAAILGTPPLPTTRRALEEWNEIASREPWVAAVAAMHGLELIAHRDLVSRGATRHYFDPSILKGSEVTEAARAFLREGYEADVGHSEEALAFVDQYANEPGLIEETQAVFLRSLDLFDDYLTARLERGTQFEA